MSWHPEACVSRLLADLSLGLVTVQVASGETAPLEPCMQQHACMLSRFIGVRLFVTLWTIAHRTPLSMGFSRQEYWNGLPCPHRDHWASLVAQLVKNLPTMPETPARFLGQEVLLEKG